jgi:hypothetical protein
MQTVSPDALNCACGRSFAQPNALANHRRVCKPSKRRLDEALLVARESWHSHNKRRRLNPPNHVDETRMSMPLNLDASHHDKHTTLHTGSIAALTDATLELERSRDSEVFHGRDNEKGSHFQQSQMMEGKSSSDTDGALVVIGRTEENLTTVSMVSFCWKKDL